MRKKAQKPDGYDVYVETLLNPRKPELGKMWTLRTNGHATTDYEMAVALTVDLTRLGIAWQIRDQNGAVCSQLIRAK